MLDQNTNPIHQQDSDHIQEDEEQEEEQLQNNSNIDNPSEADLSNDILSTSTSYHNFQQQQQEMANHRASVHPNFLYNQHNESIFDDEELFPCLPTKSRENLVKYDETNPELINQATIKALIVHMTSPEIIDYDLICDFFLTYRMFSDSHEVMNLLLTRLIWALQYLNSSIENNIRIGKLVLLRTFVVLRHWILNYFIDDFNSDYELCDLFATTMNSITLESNLVVKQGVEQNETNLNNSIFTSKILGDLKIHWLKIINEFWLLDLDFDVIMTGNNVYTYPIPLATSLNNNKKLSKSNTEISIHTNPSFRRSAMLSLYDSKTHHKTPIFDDDNNSQEERTHLSINNLFLQHDSSRISINNKINQMQQRKKLVKSPTFSSSFSLPRTSPVSMGTNVSPIKPPPQNKGRRPLKQATRHNHMNIKDSSLDLKKTKTVEAKDNDNQENIPPTASTPTKASFHNEAGFATNGHIKLPTSKVTAIVPSTPVKILDYVDGDTHSLISPGKPFAPLQPPSSPSLFVEADDLHRRGSIRKLMDSWKKTLVVHKDSNSHMSTTTSGSAAVASVATPTQGISSKPSTEDINRLITDAINVMDDKIEVGSRQDVLSARIIDELEFLIRNCITSETSSAIIELHSQFSQDGDQDEEQEDNNSNEGPAVVDDEDTEENNREIANNEVKSEVDLQPIEVSPEKGEEEEMDINDLSDLNIVKIDNLVNDSDNAYNVKVPRNISTSNILEEDQKSEESSSFQSPASINWNDEDNINIGDKTPLEEEFDEFNFLTEEPQKKRQSQYSEPGFSFQHNNQSLGHSSISTPSNITQYDAEVAELGIAMSPQLAKPKRISFCDNANTSITHSKRLSTWSRNSNGSVFRRDSMKSYVSYDSAFSIFNEGNSLDYENTEYNGLKKKTAFNDLRIAAGTAENQVIPISRSSSKSIRYSVLCALTELPFHELARLSKQSSADVADSSIFSSALKSSIRTTNKESLHSTAYTGSSNNSVAIPGISSFALKELAAIPDETIQSAEDPIQFALHKLEGKSSSKLTLKKKAENEPAEVEDTEYILNEINNAHTADVISLEDDDEECTDPPLTPIKKSNNDFTNTSTNTGNSQQQQTLHSRSLRQLDSPSVMLDNYSSSLSVEDIMLNNSHISFVMSYDSEEIAKHMTLIEADLSLALDWKDLIELKWNHLVTGVTSWLQVILRDFSGVNLVIDRFNLMVNWIVSEVLLSQDERDDVIRRFVHIAHHCVQLQNFATTMQIVVALSSLKIERYVDDEVDELLKKLCSPLNNFYQLRKATNNIQPSKGCIPFVGLYINDLVYNNERVGKINDRLINFGKFRTSVTIVKSLSQCIEWAKNYKFDVQLELLSKCLYISSLTEEEMNFCVHFLRT
ncbi:Guanine nucleotide exchange factor LTE1 [Candida viswanathii]|uniref:Guanine nucleotide exchange factor LTE1 n=1 Tax=Candida viswanathii TaxID=5486 RepID=A0A367XM84_9ASCO|nr:Guanine nucleotide exchange factor LTE1 [Candida viswanathii]